MDAARKLILERIDELGTNMAAVSRAIGYSHSYIQQFINREVPRELDELARSKLAAHLKVPEANLRGPESKALTNVNGNVSQIEQQQRNKTVTLGSDVAHSPMQEVPSAHLTGERDLPVYAAAQGGRGAIVLSSDPVDWVVRPEPLARVRDGYGVIITGDSMSPEHRSGSTALVNPHLPARSGDTCIFRSDAEDGTVNMCIKELVRQTNELWHVRQHNPRKAFTLKKSDWQVCHVTVGNYFRR